MGPGIAFQVLDSVRNNKLPIFVIRYDALRTSTEVDENGAGT